MMLRSMHGISMGISMIMISLVVAVLARGWGGGGRQFFSTLSLYILMMIIF